MVLSYLLDTHFALLRHTRYVNTVMSNKWRGHLASISMQPVYNAKRMRCRTVCSRILLRLPPLLLLLIAAALLLPRLILQHLEQILTLTHCWRRPVRSRVDLACPVHSARRVEQP